MTCTAGFGQRASRVREPDTPPVALQELQTDRLLEVPDLLGDRRLGQVEGGGGARNMLGFGHLDKGSNLLQSERRLAHGDILAWLMKNITNC